jgi:lipoprotein NlpD
MMKALFTDKTKGLLLILFVSINFASGCASDGFFDGDRTQFLYRHPRFHTVKAGETLYSIAWTYGYDYKVVAGWNDIGPPYTIHVGQRIRVAPPPEFNARAAMHGYPSFKPKDRSGNLSHKQRHNGVKDNNKLDVAIDWQWPVNGKVVRNYSVAGNGNKGVDIAGDFNQPVYAAAGGEVVYSGSGLRGYGNLIIIKHSELYLSAYAHNNKLLVKEGETLKKGTQIATMGNSDSETVMLHFEIRRDGKPVDPLSFLPKRTL